MRSARVGTGTETGTSSAKGVIMVLIFEQFQMSLIYSNGDDLIRWEWLNESDWIISIGVKWVGKKLKIWGVAYAYCLPTHIACPD
jgi:hypothetical protein